MAVLLAAVPGEQPEAPAATLALGGADATPVGRLVEQLAGHSAELIVLTRPRFAARLDGESSAAHPVCLRTTDDAAQDLEAAAEALESAGPAPVLLVGGEVVVHSAVLAGILADPRPGVTVLVGPSRFAQEGDDLAWPLRAASTVVTAASSPFHTVSDPTCAALGVMRVGPAQQTAVAGVAREVASALRAGTLTAEHVDARLCGDAAWATLLVALVRSRVPVRTVPLRGFAWARPTDRAGAERAVARLTEVDEEQARVDAAVKPDDGWFGTFFVSPYSKYLARAAARRGLTPNAVTVTSMVLGALAAGLFAVGSRPALVAGAVVLHVAFTLDCVDGQLARYTGAFSALGAYLDAVFDRVKEYLVYAGLAVGAASNGDDVWVLAAAALVLQTTHHTLQFSWPGAEQPGVLPRTGPLTAVEINGSGSGPAQTPSNRRAAAGRAAAFVSRSTEAVPGLRWAKRMVMFPIGERFAVITLGAALGGARVVFTVFLVWVSLALAWSTTGRFLRSVSR